MLNISDEEKQSLLSQHQSVYNGYRTIQLPQHDNTIGIYDPAGDKGGITVTNSGNVKPYTNVGINESMKKGETCEQCRSGVVMEGETCEQCGTKMEGSVANPEYGSFDYVEEEIEEDVYGGIQQPYSDIDFGSYDFDSKGPEQFDNDVPFELDDRNDLSLDLSTDGREMYPNEKPAYEFDSDGPLATDGTFSEMEDLEEVENVKESIKESLNWFKRFSKYN